MTWDDITSNWHQWRGRIKAQWDELTDDDLHTVRGQRDRMVGLLQERYGFSKGPAERALNEFMNGLDQPTTTMDHSTSLA